MKTMKIEGTDWAEILLARAIRVYLREPGAPQPCTIKSSVNEREVVLRNVNGELARYDIRLRSGSPVLRRRRGDPS